MDIKEIQSMFFSRENISCLNKQLLNALNKINTDRDDKKHIIDILIENMKKVYKNLELTKITNDNFPSVFHQFKKYSLDESIVEINESYKKTTVSNNFNDKNMYSTTNRNLETGHKNHNTTFMTRPVSTTITKKDTTSDNNSIAYAFKPVIDSNNTYNNLTQKQTEVIDNKIFNNINSDKNNNSNDIESLHNKRMLEVNNNKIQPMLPDFLKSSSTKINSNTDETEFTSKKKNNDYSNQIDNVPKNTNTSVPGDVEYNKEFEHLYCNNEDTLFSFENFSAPIVDNNLLSQDFDDKTSFEERLKNLQNTRNLIDIVEK